MGGRLPFDPTSMTQQPASPPPADRPLSVSQLAARIGETVASGFKGKVKIVGEVSGFRERTHWYFDLKDAAAVISCVMFSGAARKVRHHPANGTQVVVTGRIEYYERQGRITILAESIEPVGAGSQDQALKALIEEIRKLGWLEESRKRALPTFPCRVGVVTSRSGAALQDVIDTMRKRCPAVGLAIVDVRVQGDGAAGEIASAIRWFGRTRERLCIDAVLVTRGGGSKEDLWAFNDRTVAEAIVNCPVPVVAAIGHETDTSVAELVADLRCSTPTQAAMRLTPDRNALSEQVDAIANRLRTALSRDVRELKRRAETSSKALRQSGTSRIRSSAHTLEQLARRLETHRPAAVQARRQASLSSAQVRLITAMRARLAEQNLATVQTRLTRAAGQLALHSQRRLESIHKRLAAVGPASVLKRGFTYTMREDGTIVRSVSDARSGDILKTTVSDGVIRSVVENQPGRTGRRKAPDTGGMDLFGDSR